MSDEEKESDSSLGKQLSSVREPDSSIEPLPSQSIEEVVVSDETSEQQR